MLIIYFNLILLQGQQFYKSFSSKIKIRKKKILFLYIFFFLMFYYKQ